MPLALRTKALRPSFSGWLALDLLVRYNERRGESILELAPWTPGSSTADSLMKKESIGGF
ncbi:MAG: hypothetical protein DMF71_12095 [Acidobacteria bacterium]|nr:MAG: hypothetical protein DMF71_12095 [Acidobacteriota bacterium]